MKARGEENGKKILGKPQVIEGKYVLSYKPKEKKPVEEYLNCLLYTSDAADDA